MVVDTEVGAVTVPVEVALLYHLNSAPEDAVTPDRVTMLALPVFRQMVIGVVASGAKGEGNTVTVVDPVLGKGQFSGVTVTV